MNPLFIFGVSRGGTNLIARMLNEHPRVRLALDPLLPLLSTWRRQVIDARMIGSEWAGSIHAYPDYYFEPWGPTALEALLSWESVDPAWSVEESARIAHSVSERAALEDPSLAQAFESCRFESPSGALTQALDTIRGSAGYQAEDLSWVGSKEVWTVDLLPAIARVLPTARFVIVQRDPRAVVHSLIGMMRLDSTQGAHIPSYLRHWRKQTALLFCFAQDQDLQQRVLTIRYEDVLQDAAQQAERRAEFLDIEDPTTMLWPGVREGWQGNSSFGPLRYPIDNGRMRAWRGELAEDLVELTEALVAPEMALAGYRCELLEPAVHLPPTVEQSLRWCHEHPGNWRSDCGNPELEFANEVNRGALLFMPTLLDLDLIRRNYLFSAVFDEVRRSAH